MVTGLLAVCYDGGGCEVRRQGWLSFTENGTCWDESWWRCGPNATHPEDRVPAGYPGTYVSTGVGIRSIVTCHILGHIISFCLTLLIVPSYQPRF